VHCSVLQCVAVFCSVLQYEFTEENKALQRRSGCSVLQRDAAWCNVVERGAVCCSVVQCGVVYYSVVQCIAVGCSVV